MPLYRHYLALTVTGLENLNGLQPPVIFAANHISHLDVPTIYTALNNKWYQRLAPAMMKDHFRAYFEPGGRPLKEIMDDIGRRAEAQGLTPEILESLWHDE